MKNELLIVSKLHKIFSTNKWKELFESLDIDAFSSFLSMFRMLNDKEIELTLSLLEDYIFVDLNTMHTSLRRLFNNVLSEISQEQYQWIVFIPLRDDTSPTTKSQSMAQYASFHTLSDLYTGHENIVSYDCMEALITETKIRERGKSLILLTDDFIGSGSTAEKAYERYAKNYMKETDHAVILSIFCHSMGADKLKKLGLKTWFKKSVDKGISNSSKIENKKAALSIMNLLSSKLKIHKKYYLGFNSTEGLISMPFRTPNNTFPLFWCKKQKNGEEWPAPFYR